MSKKHLFNIVPTIAEWDNPIFDEEIGEWISYEDFVKLEELRAKGIKFTAERVYK